MKLSDKAYIEISQIISNETIYGSMFIYEEFVFLKYDLTRLLNCIEIAGKLNTSLRSITIFSKGDIKRKLKELNVKGA